MTINLVAAPSPPDVCLNPVPEVGMGWVGRGRLRGQRSRRDAWQFVCDTRWRSASRWPCGIVQSPASGGSPPANDAEYVLQGYLGEAQPFFGGSKDVSTPCSGWAIVDNSSY